jgi:fumarylacetoacetate (FAA) hydrolase
VKLASLKEGRDGRLVVVSRDLARAVPVPAIADTLQQALDRWAAVVGQLHAVSQRLDAGEEPAARPFDPTAAAAPLPRAYQWCDGSAYVVHVELVRQARGAELPAAFWTDPLMYQGGSDGFLGACDDIVLANEEWGLDLEAEIAVVTDDVPMSVTAADAGPHIKLLMLVNDVSLRSLIPAELAKGFGFYQSKPATAFSPVAVTPDELGQAWDGGKVNLPLESFVNGAPLGRPNAGADMTFPFPTLIAHAARTRALSAGTILGSGTVANRDRSVGSSCIAEVRMIETIAHGQPRTPFLRFGDRVRIDMRDAAGRSVFGAIDQRVVPHRPQAPSPEGRG